MLYCETVWCAFAVIMPLYTSRRTTPGKGTTLYGGKKNEKFFALLLALVMALGLLASCGDKTDGDNTGDTDGAKKIETLKVAFVPPASRRRSLPLPSP